MSERRLGNFNSCCRLCLSEKLGTLKSIFEDESRGQETAKNIRNSLGVQIHAADKLTTMICNTCSNQVNGWYSFKRSCIENQTTLIRRMNSFFSSKMGDITIQIKDEVVEPDEMPINVEDDDVVQIKAERVDETGNFDLSYDAGEVMDENSYELPPPPLTPNMPDQSPQINNEINENGISERQEEEEEDDDDDHMNMLVPYVEFSEGDTLLNGELDNQNYDARSCNMCGKHFSTIANRKKHERLIHFKNKNFNTLKNILNGGFTNNRDISQMKDGSTNGLMPAEETEFGKIQFAAELRLQQRSSNLNSINNLENISSLTNVEVRYLEKAREIVKMAETLTCSCHKKSFKEYKDLFVHLENQRIWFAMLTCYNCLTTFDEKSIYLKHFCQCTNDDLQSLKRFVKGPVNPEIKIRLYQNFKCVKCNITFGFHEDFCDHFNVRHIEFSQDNMLNCLCSEVFHSVDNFKQHCHVSCFLNHFCDICFLEFPTIEEFRLHCERLHDQADGDSIEEYDTYHKRKFGSEDENETSKRKSLPAEFLQNEDNPPLIKRRRTIQVLSTKENARSKMVINPHAIRNMKNSRSPALCPDCSKPYSSYHNMLRHYKNVHDVSGKNLNCSYCSSKFRLFSELKDHELNEHSQEVEGKTDVKPEMGSEQMNFSCPECGKLSKTIDEWRDHMETHPKKACSECDKKFTLQSELDQHRSVHLNIKVYRDSKTHDYKSAMISPSGLSCKICEKSFTDKKELHEHNLLHESMPVLSAHDEEEKQVETKPEANSKYSCIPCNKHYISYGGIWDHNKKHHGGKTLDNEYPRQCTYCEKILTSRCGWTNHVKMHERLKDKPKTVEMRRSSRSGGANDDGESYYTCKRCFKVFAKKGDLRNHMRSHGINVAAPNSSRSTKSTKSKTFWCDICHQACSGYAELQEHKKEHLGKKNVKVLPGVINQKNNDFTCHLCNVPLNSNFALLKHMDKHHSNKDAKSMSVYCKFCKVPFQDMEDFNDHMEKEHEKAQIKKIKPTNNKNGNSKLFSCTVCKKPFDNASSLSTHQGWHKRAKSGKKVLNPARGKVYNNAYKIMPSKVMPSKAMPSKAIPSKTTPSKAMPSKAMPSKVIAPKVIAPKVIPPKIMPSIITKSYNCVVCPNMFINETALQIHILEAHRNVNATLLSMSCNNCKINFDNKTAFDRHMQLHEVLEKQKGEKQKPSSLKPFPCKYCNAGFTRNDTLNAHVKEKHKDFYKDAFKCTHCERAFDKQNALTIHMKTHDRQRMSSSEIPAASKNNYSCSICKVGFDLPKDLRQHVVTAHPF